jgi:hypothetical protein
MKNILILLLTTLSVCHSFSQTYQELGVKFTLKDRLITIENIDKKFKEFKITEKDTATFVITELTINYQIEGDVVENHKLFTKNGYVEIEIMSDGLKKKIIIRRK